MAARQARTERVQRRVDPEAKSMLERTAASSNTMASAFVASHALKAASQLIRERERFVVSERDWNLFSTPSSALPSRTPCCARRSRRMGA